MSSLTPFESRQLFIKSTTVLRRVYTKLGLSVSEYNQSLLRGNTARRLALERGYDELQTTVCGLAALLHHICGPAYQYNIATARIELAKIQCIDIDMNVGVDRDESMTETYTYGTICGHILIATQLVFPLKLINIVADMINLVDNPIDKYMNGIVEPWELIPREVIAAMSMPMTK